MRAASLESYEREWQALCERYLPIREDNSSWRFSRPIEYTDPPQGWKLHVSATILSACAVLDAVAPLLRARTMLFKAPSSLAALKKLNCGLFYGYSQIGKFITVYPHEGELQEVAALLARATEGSPGPTVPFDERLNASTVVFYRYGAFRSQLTVERDGLPVPAIRAADGTLVPDRREPGSAVPAWLPDPLCQLGASARPPNVGPKVHPLRARFKAYEALSQRGKGGVYLALDLGAKPLRRCVLKEGRRHGEVDWDGRDGAWRLAREACALSELRAAGVAVPESYSHFSVGEHQYLALEFIEGTSLAQLIGGARGRLPMARALRIGRDIARVIEAIHDSGWVWRDCKPQNLMLSDHQLRPIDLEGACRIGEKDESPWGTVGYVPPEWSSGQRRADRATDLFALGATLQYVLTGHHPDGLSVPPPIGTLRRGVPQPVRTLVRALLDPQPDSRPSAATARSVLAHA
jgi:tRNA A-37 threonylcarbamoyl transferase component Bud32